MKIVVDADACPVIKQVEEVAKKYKIHVELFCDTNHELYSNYASVHMVDAGADAVDFAIVRRCQRGDVVVTQDYGLAAMILGKGAFVIHQSGWEYTNYNIDQLLQERHMAKEARRTMKGKKYPKGKGKRKEETTYFVVELERMLKRIGNK